MRLYTVHLPPAMDASRPALDRAVFVRDGFHFWAFLFGALWCLWRGLWLAAIGLLVARGVLFGLGYLLHVGTGAQIAAQLVLSLFVGLEAPDLRRWTLRRRGYAEAGTVAAANLADAERRFFVGLDAAPTAPREPVVAPAALAPRATEEVIGLFPEYRGR